VLSRVAENLYWMSRYIERAENIARLIDVNVQLLIDFQSVDDAQVKEHWLPLVRTAGSEARFLELYDEADSETVTDFLTFRRENPSSVLSCVAAARENARMIRDQLATEMWEVLNGLYLRLQERSSRQVWEAGSYEFYKQLRNASHLFQGVTDAVFPRGAGYQFMQIGRYLERADKTCRILDLKYHILLPKVSDVGGAVDAAQWTAILRSCSALEAYHRTYVSDVVPWKIAELLLLAPNFPRSVRFCVGRVGAALAEVGGPDGGTRGHEAENLCAAMVADWGSRSVGEIIQAGLHEHLQSLQGDLYAINRSVFESYMLLPTTDLELEVQEQQEAMQQQ